MHDALPPPLDRQGIGRLLLLPPRFHGSDIRVNDEVRSRLREG